MMILLIGDKGWEMGVSLFDVIVDEVKDIYHRQGIFGIVAVGRDDIWTMKRETYKDRYFLELAIRRYRRRGFEVIAVRG